MIPFVRSLAELMIITQSRTILTKSSDHTAEHSFSENREDLNNDAQNRQKKKQIILPNLPKHKRRKWIKSKEAVSRFLDNLDYNNQIQSSLDLTLLECQNNYDQQDIA